MTRRFSGATVDRRMLERARATGRRRRVLPLLLGVLLLLAGLGVYALWYSPWLTVHQVELHGASGALDKDLARGVTVPDGTPMARVDLDELRVRTVADRRVRDARVTRRWPHTIRVTVEPRVPVVAIRDPQGRVQVADHDGVLFETVPVLPEGVRLVTVKDGAASPERLSQVPPVLDALGPEEEKSLASVVLTGRKDVELMVGKVLVRWGDGSRSGEKAATLAALLRTPEAGTQGVVVDVSAPDAPAVLAPHAPTPRPTSRT